MIRSDIDLSVKGYKVALDKKIKVYQGDTFYLTFQLADTIIDEIDSVKVVDGVLPLTPDIEAYMLVGNDKVDGTVIENNRVVFKLKKEYTQEVGIHQLQIVITEIDEEGEREIVHTPEFNYEVKEAIGIFEEPEPIIPDVPPPTPSEDYARVDYAITNESMVAKASLFDLEGDIKNEEIVITYLTDKLEGGRWYSGEVITELKLNQMWWVSDDHEGRLRTIESALDELMYKPITASLSLSRTLAEMGEIVTGLRATWSYNKSPTTQSFNGVTLANTVRSYDITDTVTTNKSYTLRASDGKTTISPSVGINFYNGKYYGATAIPSTYDSNFILTLTKKLVNGRTGNFTVNCGAGQYIFFAIPARFGSPSFYVGGFEGGFGLVATISFTNSFGYKEDYNIYKSENGNLGNTTVEVK